MKFAYEESLNKNNQISTIIATISILLLFVFYTIIQVGNLLLSNDIKWKNPTIYLLWIVPGVIGIIVLNLSGFSFEKCFLSWKPISKKSLIILVFSISITLPIMLPFGQFIGWNWTTALLLSPLSGITQELFFRATLLPYFLYLFREKKHLAIFTHSILFGIWHIGVFWLAPWYAAIFVVLVPFISGYLWAIAIIRDGTIIYTIITHTIILTIMTMFVW